VKPVAAPSDAPSSGRAIGDILLARSLVTEEELDEAVAIQRETGKPLGQILVEAGTISRLELASALAEQWGDAGTISATFPGGSDYVDPTEHHRDSSAQLEELRRTRRALEERMLAFERSTSDEQWQQEISTGVRALFGRVDALEATLGSLADSDEAKLISDMRLAVVELAQRLESVTTSVESLQTHVEGSASVGALQHGLGEIAERIDALLPRLDDADTRAAAVSARVEEIAQSLVPALDEVRRAFESSAVTQEELSRRLDGAASVESVGALHEEMRRTVGDLDVRGRLDELAAVLADMRERPAVDQSWAGRLDELASRIDELAERLELGAGASTGDGEPDPRVDALIARVAELAARPAGDPALDARMEETTARLDALAAEHAERPVGEHAVESRLDEIARHVDAVAAEIAGRADAAALGDLARLVAELAERPAGDPGLAARIEHLAEDLEEIAARPAVDPSLETRLDELVVQIEELAARPAVDATLEARLDELAERVEQVPARPAEPGEVDPRVDELLVRIEELATRAETGGEIPAADMAEKLAAADDVARGVAHEVSRITTAWAEQRREVEARLEWLAARIEAMDTASQSAPAPARDAGDGAPAASAADADVEKLRMAVERLMLDFAEHRRALSAAVPSRDLDERVRKLTELVEDLSLGGGAVAAGDGGSAGGAPSGGGSVDRELVKQVRALVGRVDEVEASAVAGRDTLLARLERIMGTIDWRLQRLENPE
jgi:chromosome segregation ATPase